MQFVPSRLTEKDDKMHTYPIFKVVCNLGTPLPPPMTGNHIEKKNEEKEDVKVGDELRMGRRKWFQSMDKRLDMDNKITIQLSFGDTKFDFTKLTTKQEGLVYLLKLFVIHKKFLDGKPRYWITK